MEPPTFFQVGQRLTDFAGVDVTVAREASGGFGAVAMGPGQTEDGQWWALKMLRPDLLASQSELARQRLHSLFLREALMWKGLWPHANLLTAQTVTHIDGQLMLLLNYAEKGSLRDLFVAMQQRDRWLSFDVALELAEHIAAGLVALHTPAPDLLRDDPIVHRDLKPENVLLDQYGFAMITDFGMAKAVAEALDLDLTSAMSDTVDELNLTLGVAPTAQHLVNGRTQAYRTQRGVAMGTPAYMPPEQWRDASDVERPVDVYAFGVLLAELFSSRHPLLNLAERHSSAAWREAHATGRPIPLRKLGADVFASEREDLPGTQAQAHFDTALAHVEQLLARLLAKLPDARPTADETLAELQTVARELGEAPYFPPETYERTKEHQWTFWRGWADAYDRFDLRDEALPRIERARELAPNHPATLSSYADILMGLGRTEEALAIYQQAYTVADNDQSRKIICNQMGIVLRRLGRHADSDKAYAEAVALMPRDASAWHNRAINLRTWAEDEQEAGQVASAREHALRGLECAERAVALNQNDPQCRQQAEALRQLLGELGEAR
ncbi:MAG TPA: protein kinase [Ktedonobacterales bacterium]